MTRYNRSHILQYSPLVVFTVDDLFFYEGAKIRERSDLEDDLKSMGIIWKNWSYKTDEGEYYVYSIPAKFINLLEKMKENYPSLTIYNDSKIWLRLKPDRGYYNRRI